MFSLGKIHWFSTRCHSFHIVLAAMLAWAATFALAGTDLELLSGQPELSVIVLPATSGEGDGNSDQAQGPQIAVRWSGELPVHLQPGVEDAAGRWQAHGQPIELSGSMSLLPAPDNAADKIYRILDEAGTVLASARGESETFGWTPTFFGPGLDDSVIATTIYDGDLIAGGGFTQAGGEPVNYIARWDGSNWSALSGPNGTGMNGGVSALTVHNGDLIAGGWFTEAGGETVNRIARWNGSNWSALSGPNGTGMNDNVSALTVHNGDLVAGGHFTLAGGEAVNYIARWDGSEWSALSGPNGTGMNNYVYVLTVHNGDLIAGGGFTQAGGESVNRIARWNGSEWSGLSGPNGTGMNEGVSALTVHNGDLIAGGGFTQAGGETVNRIARWNGSEWSGLSGPNGTRMNDWVETLTIHNGDLIAGGWFNEAGGETVNRIARWNGSEWSGLSGPNGTGMNNTVRALTVHNGDLIAGGDFIQAGGETVSRIARWDGSGWSAMSGPNVTGVNGWVYALTVHNGNLIAGGWFTQAGGVTVNNIARWDGSGWSALSGPNGTGTGIPDSVYGSVQALTVHNGDLIAGGGFTQAGGEPVNYIARWDGSNWSALSGPNGTGMNNTVQALTVYNGDLIAGGWFTQAGGEPVNRIARWDGSEWSGLSGPNGTGMNSDVLALTVHNGDLIAGGNFTQAGGETVNRIARWDGSNWSALSGPNGTGMNNTVRALTVHNGDLIAGGTFIQAGGMAAWSLARWQLEATVTQAISVEQDAVNPGEPVLVVATVTGPASTPDGGLRGRIEADSGEFCEADVVPAVSTTAIFFCEITLDHPGIRSLTAYYTGSARYHPSQSEPVQVEVSWLTLEVEVTGQGSVTAVSPTPVADGIVDCDEAATGSSACKAGYVDGDIVALSLDPANGWFIEASDGCGGELAGTTYTTAPMTDDCTVTVSFTTEHTLNYSAGSGGSLTGETSQTVQHGSSGTPVTAVPDAGFRFVQWSDGRTDNPRIDANVTADINVEAQWQQLISLDAVTPASGPGTGGTAVTLTGSAFQAGATVNFGGNACTNINVVSSTEISCDTPPGAAGTVDVVVENPDSQTATLSDGFTYIVIDDLFKDRFESQ